MFLCIGDRFGPKKYAWGRGSNVGYRSAGPVLGDCEIGHKYLKPSKVFNVVL